MLRCAGSAFGPRISADRSRFVVEHCLCPLYPTQPIEDEDLVAYLGPDAHRVALEVIAIELSDGDVLVIHAMKLRRRYRADYERVMECQNG